MDTELIMYKLISCLVALWLVIRERLSICSDGCLICDGKDTCKLCDAASLYVLVKDTCVKQDLDFCILSFNIDSCAVCFDGYYLESNNKCVTNPAGINEIKNCVRYSSYTRCSQCQKNFYLADNNRKCEKVNDKIQNCKVSLDADKCKICSDSILNANSDNCNTPDRSDGSCMFYSDRTLCKTCQDGYYLNYNYYNDQIVNIYPKLINAILDYPFTYNSVINLPQCTKIEDIPYCISLDDSFNCVKCANGYYVNTTTYRECLKNPDQVLVIYSTDIPYCYLHNRVTTTVNGVTTTTVTCKFCYEGYYITVNGKKCSKHSKKVNNCKIYSQTKDSECLLCVNGYYRSGTGDQKCFQRGENSGCSVVNPMSESCDTCVQSNYVKYNKEKFCAPPIVNCKIYNLDSTELTCKTCESGYYFNINTKTCEINLNFDAYCSYYDQEQKCAKCFLGYFYNKISGKCEPSDSEYVYLANCADYDATQKNTCVDCDNFNVLTQLANNCKLIPFDSTLFNITKITNCDTYEVDTEGNYHCTKAVYMNADEIPYCKPDLSNCTVRVLNTTDGLVYTNPKSISNCISYQPKVEGLKTIECLACMKNITMVDYFYTSNVCDNAEKIPWCPDGNVYRGPNNFCSNATGTGGRIFIGKTADANTNFVSTTYIQNGPNPQYLFCHSANTNLPCFYRGNNAFYNTYICGNPTPVLIGNTKNCKYFDGYSCGTEGLYERTLTYNVTLTEDNTECIIERIYHTIDNCFKISNYACVLCERGYYPDRYKQILYPMDYVETYLSHLGENNMDNCINYNSLAKECVQCDPNSGTKLNFSGRCVSCTSSDKCMDKTELKCLSFFSESLPAGSCQKADDIVSPYACIQCTDNYVATYDVIYLPLVQLTMAEYLYVKGQKTYLGKLVDTFRVGSCLKKTDLFISNINYKNNSMSCDWARVVLGTSYCLKCTFGYSGSIGVTIAGVEYLENCLPDPTCDVDSRYIFNQTHVRQLLSCHNCVSNIKIITLYTYFEKNSTAANANFKFSNSTKTWACEPVDSTLDSNCLVQLYVNDTIFKPKVGNRSYLCLSCPPKYRASTTAVPDNLYPFEYVTSCTLIKNCLDSNITNVCEQCEPGYTLTANKTWCNPIPAANPELTYCNVIGTALNQVYCVTCKNGYIYLQTSTVNTCLPYNANNCLYFDGDRCVQSTKKMGTAYNIIYRRNFESYYISQPTCKSAINAPILNCEFYKTNVTCYICSDGYYLGNKNTTCYTRNITNCKTYDDLIMKCAECMPGYYLDNNRACQTSNNGTVSNCAKYSGIYCTECITGFYPIRINNDQGSICLNTTISNLCEEIDYNELTTNNVLKCKTCSKISEVITKLNQRKITLNEYSFVLDTTYSKYVANNNQFQYDSAILTKTYLRAALVSYKNTNICKQYGGVANCTKHDDTNFSKSFKCQECLTTSFLQNNVCYTRTLIENCKVYNPTQNVCSIFLDSTDLVFQYSTFDYMVMNQNIPSLPDDKIIVFSIDGCTKYYNSGYCQYCNSTMYLYDNLCLSVTKLIPHCYIYVSDMVCSVCESGFLLLQNKCLQIFARNCDGYLTNTKCLRCLPEFPNLKSDGNCYKNDNVPYCDVFANPTSCKYCSSDYSNEKGQCVLPNKYLNDCERHKVPELCMKCSNNKVLTGNLKACESNPTYDRNCKEFESKAYCLVCAPGYYFKGFSCYPCMTDKNKCWLCDYKNPAICKVCQPGFFMDNFGNCMQSVGYQSQNVINFNQDTDNLNVIKGSDSALTRIVVAVLMVVMLLASDSGLN